MRVKGENVSAFEVENIIQTHPKVLECAAFAVPSELAEDEIMVVLVLKEDESLEGAKLIEWLDGKLARFAVPRYVRFVDKMPKTPTHRVIKRSLKDMGITADTIDLESCHV
jgi:crotonobetaine/carnitine-CoA ligase